MARRRPLALLLGWAALTACAAGGPASSRDILWTIVAECLDPARPGYCSRCPSPIGDTCGPGRGCTGTTEVWAETPEYVAIRDVKMCGCPAGFVHGLALPRARVTGPEDARRPAGIWSFAWDSARARIADEMEIALVVNPPRLRTQDQLHVHLLRLAPGVRARLASRSPARGAALHEVWDVAARSAAAAGLLDYGVLVVRDEAAGFLVLVEGLSPEDQFTAATCRAAGPSG
jgi:CDP-diacylglycerol pyrophosphatase